MSLDRELFKAISSGNKDLVRGILARGARVDPCDENGNTALHFAAGAPGTERREIAALLLERGADVNAARRDGDTPLHIAAYYGHADVADFLIEHGADVNASNGDRLTPLHLAAEKGRKETVALLLTRGTDTAARGIYGTPLETAEIFRQAAIAALLRDHYPPGPAPGDVLPRFAAAEQTVADVLALVKRHRGDDDRLEDALRVYFGVRERRRGAPHPRINPTSGRAVEHD